VVASALTIKPSQDPDLLTYITGEILHVDGGQTADH
jgi:hypothetical protein